MANKLQYKNTLTLVVYIILFFLGLGLGINSFIQNYTDCKTTTHFSLEQILSPPTSIPFWGQRVFWYSKYISQTPQGSGNARFVTLWAARAVWKVCWGRLSGDAGWRQAVIPLVGRWKGMLIPASLWLMCYLSLHWPLAFLNGNVELKLGAVESLGLRKELYWRNVNCAGTKWISKFIHMQSGMLHRHWDRLWILTAVIVFTNWAWFRCIPKNTSQLKSIKTTPCDSDKKYSRA